MHLISPPYQPGVFVRISSKNIMSSSHGAITIIQNSKPDISPREGLDSSKEFWQGVLFSLFFDFAISIIKRVTNAPLLAQGRSRMIMSFSNSNTIIKMEV
jgi:hypothetical protein